MAALAIGVEILFGIGLWTFLKFQARPSWAVRPRVPGVTPGSVTLPSDTRGLA